MTDRKTAAKHVNWLALELNATAVLARRWAENSVRGRQPITRRTISRRQHLLRLAVIAGQTKRRKIPLEIVLDEFCDAQRTVEKISNSPQDYSESFPIQIHYDDADAGGLKLSRPLSIRRKSVKKKLGRVLAPKRDDKETNIIKSTAEALVPRLLYSAASIESVYYSRDSYRGEKPSSIQRFLAASFLDLVYTDVKRAHQDLLLRVLDALLLSDYAPLRVYHLIVSAQKIKPERSLPHCNYDLIRKVCDQYPVPTTEQLGERCPFVDLGIG
jgi:hypothetical protein